ncbi:MAG: Unknown protein [uncultured Sulfurovum sp.]|uniref:Glycoside hydrolase family 42 N-terminal domain-containing protein n=1 Tax=uncultured Sulfurovum sp. TaxID=269237 RepID=A0A6S6TEL4_9BACT|nr:MAG: Unknown protein [uncultured Sulfurovum sp.]
MKKIIFLGFLLLSPLLSNQKHLILAEGNGWFPHMAKNLVANHERISKLPFSGFIMVGNRYTNLVMDNKRNLTYEYVWNEVKAMQGLYKKQKHNFLQVNILSPGDFWDVKAWQQVTHNFGVIAKVARDLGFKGIVFDDEAYNKSAKSMLNFKFPTINEVQANPKKYTEWEKKGAEHPWVDKNSYRNPHYTFKEHIEKITFHFKNIMQTMVKNYPNIEVLVYLGPSLSHVNSNKKHPIVVDLGRPRNHEFHGAIFLGLKQGLNNQASLHDMGESYKYRENKHFKNAYEWRKYGIAKDESNNKLNQNYQWSIPKSERATWSNEIKIGFMVSNKGQKSTVDGFTTLHKSTLNDIEQTLKKALNFSDKYVIYYSREQDWLLPNQKYPLPSTWMKMMQKVYKNKSNQ